MNVFVAAPFACYKNALDMKCLLKLDGHAVACSWAEAAEKTGGVEDLDGVRPSVLHGWLDQNESELMSADVFVALTDRVLGGQMLVEAGMFYTTRRPILWCGPRKVLMRHAAWVVLVRTMSEVPNQLKWMEADRAEQRKAAEHTRSRIMQDARERLDSDSPVKP